MSHYAHKAAVRQVNARRINTSKRSPQRARRAQLGVRNTAEPFSPPETWHESCDNHQPGEYKIKIQSPGEGYQHVVTPQQIRDRLTKVPQRFLDALEVVQLSGMTRKKQSFPCYGMQWGTTLYLYPLEESLEEFFYAPPGPLVVNEAKMYGGLWDRPDHETWRLRWAPETIADFYLNNILIHELGHLVDERNTSYAKREQYAEWFAIEHGYRASGGGAARRKRSIRRRHHAK